MNSILQDLRYAVRMLAKSPGFAAIAVLTLALGIGANTAIFSLIDAVMLKTLPVKDPQQLVLLSWDTNKWPGHFGQTGGDSKLSFSYPAFEEFQAQNQVLSSVFAFVPLGFTPQNTTVSVNGEPTLANGMMVTGNYFSGLGVTPLLGRGITDADEPEGAARVAVISYAYWTRRFARDQAIIGKGVALNGIPFTIAGVTPPEFYGVQPGGSPDIWMAFADKPNLRPWGSEPYNASSVFTAKDWICLNIMGRLKPATNRTQAEAALDVIFRNMLTSDWKPDKPDLVPHLQLMAASQGIADLREGFEKPLSILMWAVGLVLLIACANLATLLLARAAGRQKEISVRLAMGGTRSRIVRQLLTESILLSAIGGALGLLVANWGTRALLALISSGDSPIALDVRPDPKVLLFTTATSALTGILFGIAPAFRAAKIDLASAIRETASNISGGGGNRLGKSLVVAQVAASLVLMIGAGLYVRTLQNMQNKNLGFNQSHLLLFGLDPTRTGYHQDALVNLFTQLHQQIQALPGVKAATLYEFAPFTGWSSNTTVTVEGLSHKVDNKMVRFGTVGPDFFATMQVPVILGRDILSSDTTTSPKVAVVNQTFVKNFFAGENPVGQTFKLGNSSKGDLRFQIVGVIKDLELTDLHDNPRPKAFLPYTQIPDRLNTMYFEIRTAGDPTALLSEIRNAVRQIDPDLPLMNVRTQLEQTSQALSQERLFARLSTFFGLVALLLACIGLYGTMAYSVTRKTHEIGIRMALGARPTDVLGMVITQGLQLALIGVVIGIAAGFGLTRLIASMMYGVSPSDPATFAIVSIVLIVVAALACFIPARRAMQVDPIIALRYE
jgi:predicted permease